MLFTLKASHKALRNKLIEIYRYQKGLSSIVINRHIYKNIVEKDEKVSSHQINNELMNYINQFLETFIM